MPKAVTVKLPNPLSDQLDDLMKKEDKENRNAMICELLEMAIRIRALGKDPNNKIAELIEMCTTKVILQINSGVGELIRYHHNPDKSQYPECTTPEALLANFEEKAKAIVDEYKGVNKSTQM